MWKFVALKHLHSLFLLGINKKKHAGNEIKYTCAAFVKHNSAFAHGSAGRCAEQLIWEQTEANLD